MGDFVVNAFLGLCAFGFSLTTIGCTFAIFTERSLAFVIPALINGGLAYAFWTF